MSQVCPRCRQEVHPQEVKCRKCGTELARDLFSEDDIANTASPEPTPPPPQTSPMDLAGEDEPKLTLAFKKVTLPAQAPKPWAEERKAIGRTEEKQVEEAQLAGEEGVVGESLRKFGVRRFLGIVGGTFAIGLVVLLVLITQKQAPSQPEAPPRALPGAAPKPAASGPAAPNPAAAPASVAKANPVPRMLGANPKGTLSPAQAVAAVGAMVGKPMAAVASLAGAAPPAGAAAAPSLQELESKLAAGDGKGVDVEKYVEEMAARSGPDGTNVDPLTQALVYGDIEDYPAARAKAMAEVAVANQSMAAFNNALEAQARAAQAPAAGTPPSGGAAPAAASPAPSGEAVPAAPAAGLAAVQTALEKTARNHPYDPQIQQALAESVALTEPERALTILSRLDAAAGERARGLALLATGRFDQARPILGKVAERDPSAARLLAESLARAAQCDAGLALAQRVAAEGGVPGTIFWLRYQTLCATADADKALSVGQSVLAMEQLPPADRANLAAALALAYLWNGDLPRAAEHCARAAALAPTLPSVVLAGVRCKLAGGTLPAKAALPLPGSGVEHVLQAVAALSAGEDPQDALAAVPGWSAGAALVRLLDGLRKKAAPAEVVLGIGEALLAPRNPEVDHFPLSPLEMQQLVTLAPARHQPLAQAVAAILGRNAKQAQAAAKRLPAPLSGLLLCAIAFQQENRREADRAVRKLHALSREPLGQFFLAWAQEKPGRLKAMRALTDHPALGPYALWQLRQDGDLDASRLEQARARWPKHPRMFATLSAGQ